MSFAERFLKAFRTSPKADPQATATILFGGGGMSSRGKVGKPNAMLFRNWAEHSPWIRAAINIRKTQVSQSEFDIVRYDTNKPIDKGLQQEIRDLFDQPNQMTETFRTWIEPIVEDTLVLDAGVVEKERTLGGRLVYLHSVDGARVKVSALWDGDDEEPRYFFYPSPLTEVSFRNSDMLYIASNPRTYSPVGLANLETLKNTIDAEIEGSMYNVRQVKNAAPDGLLHLGEGIREEKVEEFRSFWNAEVAGKGALAITGGGKNPNFIPFRASNRDMQYNEWLTYLVRQICAVFLISPQDLGLTFDINRATAEQQAEQTEDRGLRPLLSLFQDVFTREIVWDAGFGGSKNNLAFRFTRLNIKESMSKANVNKLALAGMPWKTINEARLDEGREPIGDPLADENPNNKLMANTPLGVVVLDDILSAAEVAAKPQPTAGAGQPEGGDAPKAPPKRKPSSAKAGDN